MLQIPLQTKAQHLTGIVELDETYFFESHKGERDPERQPRKRGGSASKRGISEELIPPTSLFRYNPCYEKNHTIIPISNNIYIF